VFRCLRFDLAAFTVIRSLPLLTISLLLAALGVGVIALLPLMIARRGSGGLDFQRQWTKEEFRFEDAVQSYENLIDAQLRRRR
jgi:hypothetical protein